MKKIVKTYRDGDIALCNLLSFKLTEFYPKSEEEQYKIVYNAVKNLDNTIDLADYPIAFSIDQNKRNRYLGIGVSDLVNLLALNKIVIDTQESLEFQAELFDKISYMCIKASMQLAQEKGRCEGFAETKYAQGMYPYMLGNQKAKELVKYRPDFDKWNALMEDVKKYGMRNCTLLAIAPTACVTKETRIRTSKGVQSYIDIMNEQGIDFESLEKENVQKWIDFKEPIEVPTRFGVKQSKRIWFNGKQPVRLIGFSDGTALELTHNHKLLVRESGNELWVEASELKAFDKVVNIDGQTREIKGIKDGKSEFTYDIEVEGVHEYLLENGCVSHNTSGRAVNALESIEPIYKFIYSEDGEKIQSKTIVPNFKKNNKYYKSRFDCDPVMLIKGAAVRQLFIDQSQSVSIYSTTINGELNALQNSSYKLSLLHLLAWELGIKTLYYFSSQKDEEEEVCESCT